MKNTKFLKKQLNQIDTTDALSMVMWLGMLKMKLEFHKIGSLDITGYFGPHQHINESVMHDGKERLLLAEVNFSKGEGNYDDENQVVGYCILTDGTATPCNIEDPYFMEKYSGVEHVSWKAMGRELIRYYFSREHDLRTDIKYLL